jgi:hypothetical protein
MKSNPRRGAPPAPTAAGGPATIGHDGSAALHGRLLNVSRMATIGEIAAGVAHELNQPLTAIANYAHACERLLARPGTDPADLHEALRQITAQTIRAADIVRRLRALAYGHPSEHVPVGINFPRRHELRLESLSFTHITDRSRDQGAVRRHGTEAYLDRELRAIAAPGEQRQPGAHRPQTRGTDVVTAMLDMAGAKSFRHQLFERLPDQLVVAVTEQHSGLPVGETDDPAAVDHDQRVGRRIERIACQFAGERLHGEAPVYRPG